MADIFLARVLQIQEIYLFYLTNEWYTNIEYKNIYTMQTKKVESIK